MPEMRSIGATVRTPFRTELEALINKHNLEAVSGTPDFILAIFVCDCLAAYDRAVKARNVWAEKAGTL